MSMQQHSHITPPLPNAEEHSKSLQLCIATQAPETQELIAADGRSLHPPRCPSQLKEFQNHHMVWICNRPNSHYLRLEWFYVRLYMFVGTVSWCLSVYIFFSLKFRKSECGGRGVPLSGKSRVVLNGGPAIHTCHGPLTRYVKLQVAHAPGMPGTFSLSPTSKETAI